MPLLVKLFDEQLRFKLTPAQKAKLFAQVKRRHVAGADLLGEYIDSLPDPEPHGSPRSGAA
jgi:hypothetical protein